MQQYYRKHVVYIIYLRLLILYFTVNRIGDSDMKTVFNVWV